jgi:hypothetical protein
MSRAMRRRKHDDNFNVVDGRVLSQLNIYVYIIYTCVYIIYIMNVKTHEESPTKAIFVFTQSGHQRWRRRFIIII